MRTPKPRDKWHQLVRLSVFAPFVCCNNVSPLQNPISDQSKRYDNYASATNNKKCAITKLNAIKSTASLHSELQTNASQVSNEKEKNIRREKRKNGRVIHSFDIGFNAQTLFIFQELFEMRTRLFRIDTKNKRNEAIASVRRWLPAALNLVRHFFSYFLLVFFGCCCTFLRCTYFGFSLLINAIKSAIADLI